MQMKLISNLKKIEFPRFEIFVEKCLIFKMLHLIKITYRSMQHY